MAKSTGSDRLPRGKRVAFYLALLVFAGVIAAVLGEIALRVFPIPGIRYHSFYYDPVTGGTSYPHSTLWYRGDDGVLIRHRTNAWGFADVEHEMAAAPGTLRIGFFGDSYTEAVQVPLEAAFFRRVEAGLNARAGDLSSLRTRDGRAVREVETLAFGVPGRSTLQSWLESRNWVRPLDLDYVVYVFVENDPADQIRSLKQADTCPYPVLAADSFTIDDSFNRTYAYKTSWWHRAVQRVKAHSLLVSTVKERTRLLQAYGIKRAVTPADRTGGEGAAGSPMRPSTWPPALVQEGWTLQERVMDRWRRDVERDGRCFVIMRVPREELVGVPVDQQDSWTPRLQDWCARNGVPLVDPTPIFIERMKAGEKMHHDHFTPEGHRAFAESFVQFMVEGGGKASSDSTAVPLE